MTSGVYILRECSSFIHNYRFMSKKAPFFREEMNCDKHFNKNGISYLIDGNK